jgi:hypothetical protein
MDEYPIGVATEAAIARTAHDEHRVGELVFQLFDRIDIGGVAEQYVVFAGLRIGAEHLLGIVVDVLGVVDLDVEAVGLGGDDPVHGNHEGGFPRCFLAGGKNAGDPELCRLLGLRAAARQQCRGDERNRYEKFLQHGFLPFCRVPSL